MSKVVWIENNNVFVVSKSKTSNAKIVLSKSTKIIQTYTFSLDQYKLATTSKGFGMKKFFALDQSNCLDCPFSMGNGNGGCYTHKFNQYVGFLSMLRSIDKNLLTPLDETKYRQVLDMSKDTYVRFGTYGEPSLLPSYMVESMSLLSSSWTGYTHQWQKPFAKEYGKYFMASTHNEEESKQATDVGYRSFIATENHVYSFLSAKDAVGCPASKEMGYKSSCDKCGLCSGTQGKGKKNIKILIH